MGSIDFDWLGLVFIAIIIGSIAIGLYELVCWLFSFITISWA